MPNSSNSNSSGSNSSAASGVSRATTAKAMKAAEKARLTARRANAASVRNNVTRKFAKLPAELRKQAQGKLKEIRADPDMDTAERVEAEEKLFGKIERALAKQQALKEAEKAARAAETAAKRDAAKSARASATAAKRVEKERELAQAKANLKEYLGESPKKKNIEALHKARKNKRNMTARNYAKAAGLSRTRKLTNSAKKLQKKQKSVAADFVAKGVDGDEFCGNAVAYAALKARLEKVHKEKALKHSLATIVEVCGKDIVRTPGSGSANSS
jgi:hypothetical protein